MNLSVHIYPTDQKRLSGKDVDKTTFLREKKKSPLNRFKGLEQAAAGGGGDARE